MEKMVLSAADISAVYNQVFSTCDRLGLHPCAYGRIPVLLQKESDRLQIVVEVPSEYLKGKREQ